MTDKQEKSFSEKQKDLLSGQERPFAEKQEDMLSKKQNEHFKEENINLDKEKSFKEEEILYGQDKELQQTVNDMNAKSFSNLKQEENNKGKDPQEMNVDQQRLIDEAKQIHQKQKTPDENETKNKKTEQLVKNVAQTDIPFVRLVKEEKIKENVEPGSGDDSQNFANNNNNNNNNNKNSEEDGSTKQTVVNFKTDDLKTLEDNLFAAFEKRIRSKAFNGTIESLKGLNVDESGLVRHLNAQSHQDVYHDEKSSDSTKETKTVIKPQSFLERLREREEENEKKIEEKEQTLLTDETSNQKVNNPLEYSNTIKTTEPIENTSTIEQPNNNVIDQSNVKKLPETIEISNNNVKQQHEVDINKIPETIAIEQSNINKAVERSESTNTVEQSNTKLQPELTKDTRPQASLRNTDTESSTNHENIGATITEQPMMYQTKKEDETQTMNNKIAEEQNMITLNFNPTTNSINNDPQNGQFMDKGERANYIAKYKDMLDKPGIDLDALFSRKAVLKYTKPEADSDAHYWSPKAKGKPTEGFMEDTRHFIEGNGVQTGFIRSQPAMKVTDAESHLQGRVVSGTESNGLVGPASKYEKPLRDIKSIDALKGVSNPEPLSETTHQVPAEARSNNDDVISSPNQFVTHKQMGAEFTTKITTKPIENIDEVPEGRYLIPISRKKLLNKDKMMPSSEGAASSVSSLKPLEESEAKEVEGSEAKGLDGQYLIKIR